jgi:hypothetical protein
MPLTEEEQKFVDYWARERTRQRKTMYQLLVGLPLGLLFALPIGVNFLLGRFWYKRADAVGNSQFNPIVLLVAVMGIAVFIAIFQKKYQEFIAKRDAGNKKSGDDASV